MSKASYIGTSAVQPHDEMDLTDDQVQELLLEAESRLQGSQQNDTIIGADPARSDRDPQRIPKLSSGRSLESYVHQGDESVTVDTAQIIDPKQKQLSNSLCSIEAKKSSKHELCQVVDHLLTADNLKDKPTAGPDWFDLPKTELTPELRRDLQLLRMRSVLDPKRHYKKESGKAKPPEFSQVGTIIEGPTEFFSGRIAKKDRKKTFVEEALALERETKRFTAKYKDIQSTKQSGKNSFYKNLRAKRARKYK